MLNNANALSLGTKSFKKKGTLPIWTAHLKQKSSVTLTVVSKNDSRAVYVGSSESCEHKRCSLCWNKVEKKYIQEQQSNQFHSYNQNKAFFKRMDQNIANYKIGIQMKKWRWPSFVWMVDVLLQGAWVLYRINKYEGDEFLLLLVFRRHIVNAVFQKYSKEGRLSSNHVGIQNNPWDNCYDDKKHYRCNLNADVLKTLSI